MIQDLLRKYGKYVLLAALIYLPIFGHLDSLAIRLWDETRLAINAYEMLKQGDYLVTHYNGSPDMWNTKPPLLVWCQVVFMKLLGVNELAVRLPSALAAFFTCVILLVFSLKFLKNFWFGFIAILVLITTQGFIHLHATRTGDYDAMLTLFTTSSCLLFFAYSETKRVKYLYLFFTITAFAVLTKSVTGLLFLPGIFIYVLTQHQFILLLKNRHLYLGMLIFVLVVASYYGLREFYNPGYLEAVFNNELGGRYLNALEGHQHGFWYYLENNVAFRYTYWYIFIPCGLILGLVNKNQKVKRLAMFLFLLSASFFLIISSAQTKLEWYDVPLYPLLALLIAIFVYFIFDLLKNSQLIHKSLNYKIAPFLFLFLLAFKPYKEIINKTQSLQENEWNKEIYEISYYLKDALKGKHQLDKHFLLDDGKIDHYLFYLNILKDRGIDVSVKQSSDLKIGDLIIVFKPAENELITSSFLVDTISIFGNVKTYRINEFAP